MTSFEALNLFKDQLSRISDGTTFKTKVVLTPSSIKEAGLVIKVTLLKSVIDTRSDFSKNTRILKFRVEVSGSAESQRGLEQAVEAIESLDSFFMQKDLRLEKMEGGFVKKIANTRIVQKVSEEDSFIDSPDSTQVQDVEDIRFVYITIPVY
ncbi:MAG: hypothetical protein ACTTHG_02895 [Treponemataceae bacterium]